jgi:hypothetical protein
LQSDSENMHANPKRPCVSWTVLAWIATFTLLTGGCARLQHAWHYNYVTKTIHEQRLSYYHSPHTGRVMPEEHSHVCPVELPCFGYEPTCWHRFPDECMRCPLHPAEQVIVEGPEQVLPAPQAEATPQPAAGQATQPQPADATTPEPRDIREPDDLDSLLDDAPLPNEGAEYTEPSASSEAIANSTQCPLRELADHAAGSDVPTDLNGEWLALAASPDNVSELEVLPVTSRQPNRPLIRTATSSRRRATEPEALPHFRITALLPPVHRTAEAPLAEVPLAEAPLAEVPLVDAPSADAPLQLDSGLGASLRFLDQVVPHAVRRVAEEQPAATTLRFR